MLQLKPGDMLVVLGDENPESMGIALVPERFFLGAMDFLTAALKRNHEDAPYKKEDDQDGTAED